MKNKHVYRVPLRHFSDLGKINFPTKIDYRIKLHLETEMKKLFKSRKVLAARAAIPLSYAKIYSLKHHLFNINKYYLIKILGDILKQ